MIDTVSDEFVSFGQVDTFIGLVGPIHYRNLGDRTETRLKLERRHVNPMGSAHGGLLMTVMDITLGSTAGASVGFGPGLANRQQCAGLHPQLTTH